jgi:hypothetical protein
MPVKRLTLSAVAGLATLAFLVPAQAQKAMPNLAGTYRCQPEPQRCDKSGQTFTVTQSGAKLEIKSDNGGSGEAKMTSATTLSVAAPWNMIGEVLPDHTTIQWSNGTDWRKQ